MQAAIMRAHDLLSRCLIPFVVLGDTAYQMRNNIPLEGHKIVLGVRKRHAVPEQTSLLKVLEPSLETLSDGWRLVHDNVPVYIKVLDKEIPTIIDPDIVFYWIETFYIPNPFDLYWNSPNHYDI